MTYFTLCAFAAVFLLEAAGGVARARWFDGASLLEWTAALRLVEAAVLIGLSRGLFRQPWREIGLDLSGWRGDLAWAAAFGIGLAGCAAIGEAVARLGTGASLVTDLAGPPPEGPFWAELLIRGAIGPFAEDLFFWGILYPSLRRERLPAWIAIPVAAALFAALHGVALPVTQFIGGVLFAALFEARRSLLAPFALHASGNVALLWVSRLAA